MKTNSGPEKYYLSLNESPSEKEGKFCDPNGQPADDDSPSMKVPPKRKGNNQGL